MALRDFTVSITGAAQQLNTAALTVDATRGGTRDEGYREIILSADTDCFIGSSSALTVSSYGNKIFAQTNATPPLTLGPFEAGPIKLSDIWFIGTTGKLHVLGIPF